MGPSRRSVAAMTETSVTEGSKENAHTRMSSEQIDAFLAEARHAIAGVIRSNGAPQLSPVWFLYENGRVYFSIFVDSAKFRHLERDPRISLCVDAGHPDARAVLIQGTVELVRESSAWTEDVSWKIVRRYHETEEEARLFDSQSRSQGPSALVVVSSQRIIGRDFN
jgi:PPOX class probable F420-dependent enzyme